MKKTITISLLLLYSIVFYGQVEVLPKSNINLGIWIPDSENFTPATKKLLESKLKRLSSKQGFSNGQSRFIISADLTILSKEVVNSYNPKVKYELGISFYIGDGIEGRAFNSTYVEVTGSAGTQAAALRNAINSINVNDKALVDFINTSRQDILDYYKTNCGQIIKDAELYAKMDDQDSALVTLLNIPDSAGDCRKKGLDLAMKIYQEKLDNDCKVLLSKAQGVWHSGKTQQHAEEAMEYLSEINPGAKCFDKVVAFQKEVGQFVSEERKREWDMRIEKEVNLPKQMIKAYRDVEVERNKKVSNNVVYKSLF